MKKLMITFSAFLLMILMFSGRPVYAQGNALTCDNNIIEINPQLAENLDTAISIAYDFFTNRNYSDLCAYTFTDEVTSYKEILNGLDSDRYFVAIGGKEYGMLYVTPSGKVAWYFGEIKNGLRNGSGYSILLDQNVYKIFSGKYNLDMPDGEGQYTFILPSSGEFWSMSGVFKGIYMNGEYSVHASHPSLGANTVPLTYKDNHLVSQETSFIENEKTYLLNISMENNTVAYASNDNTEYSGTHKIKVPEGYELVGVITYPDRERIYYIYDSIEELNVGNEIFMGCSQI